MLDIQMGAMMSLKDLLLALGSLDGHLTTISQPKAMVWVYSLNSQRRQLIWNSVVLMSILLSDQRDLYCVCVAKELQKYCPEWHPCCSCCG